MSMMRDGDSKRIDLGKYIIVRLKRNKKTAEMIVDPKKAWISKKKIEEKRKELSSSENPRELTIKDLKELSDIDINDIFEGLVVFQDVMKGDVYPEAFLEEMFETTNATEIAYQFLVDSSADYLWTKEQRDEYSLQKKRQIVNILAKNCINPQTKKPHPPDRLERAIKESKYNINMTKSAEEQIKDVIRAISPIIAIRMENVELAIKIPTTFAAKTYGTVEKFGRIKQSEWQNDGSWVGVLDLPAGLEAEFLDKINKSTRGRAQIKVLKRT